MIDPRPGPIWLRIAGMAARLSRRIGDPAGRGHYRLANAVLLQESDRRSRVVFVGDSIFEGWRGLRSLAPDGVRFINRGIAGQTSRQMLMRFGHDALALAPRGVVILAGTNDLRAWLGDPATVGVTAAGRVIRNVRAMADLAAARGAKVILCTLPPIRYGLGPAWRGAARRDAAAVRQVNAGLRAIAAERGHAVVDFHLTLADTEGRFARDLTDDGVHPNLAGYDRMAAALRTVSRSLSAS